MKRSTANFPVPWRARFAGLFVALALTDCGGGGSAPYCSPMCQLDKYASLVGGTLTGLVGSGLTFQFDGTPLSTQYNGPAANGTHGFAIFTLDNSWDLTVDTQPTNPSQTCVVTNGQGGPSYSNITNIVVTCTTNPARFVYVTNSGSNNVSAYTVDAASGTLSPIAGSPFATGNLPVAIAVDPTGSYVYVVNQTDATISAFAIDRASGALTEVGGSPFSTGPTPTSVAVAKSWPPESGTYVYVTSGTTGSVTPCQIIAGGALSCISSSTLSPTGASPSSVVSAPLLSLLYVGNQGDNTVSVLNVGEGGVVTGSPFPAGAGPRAVAVDISGNYVYVANSTSNTLSGYQTSSAGPLTRLSGSPYATGNTPDAVAADLSDNFVYVANKGSNNVSAYALGAGGTLTALSGSPFTAGGGPVGIVVDPTNQFVYVANAGSADISVFTIDRDNGALSTVSGSPYAAGSGPSAIAISQ